MKKRLYPLLLIAWVIVLGWEAFSMTRAAHQLVRMAWRQETAGSLLSNKAKALSAELKSQTAELAFLQRLDILPKDKGYVRTQNAISDDVATLRRRLAWRVEGETYVAVDSRANKLYLRRGLITLWEADCSVGRGGLLTDRQTGRKWLFLTPRGEFRVLRKIEKPIWTKPDWAFVETKQPVPPPGDPLRKVEGELGNYALDLGNGYLIHGTKNENLLGHSVSHGCVRLGADNLEKLFKTVPIGTRVYIY